METARKLRRDMSYPEVLLWQRLRRAPTGIRFRRGHPVGLDYVADFYCPSAKLVIEVDGQIHDQPGVVARDATRDDFMRQRGLIIVRIPARDILRNADEAAAAIVALALTPLHHRPSAGGPPPRAGEDQE
nr:endonuclease domain-containing protein [Sphingomonas sp.]